jgi:predicted nucleic acid-binding protein
VLSDLIRGDAVVLLGAIWMEVLSGLRVDAEFEALRDYLRYFEDEPLDSLDYEEAAQCSNTCLAAGIATTAIDLLICAAAIRRGFFIFTLDTDFGRYAKHLPIQLPSAGELQRLIQQWRDA